MITLGQKIRKLRELNGFSQDYMARKLGISQEQYSYIETKQKNITEAQKSSIASLLGLSVDFLENFDPQNIFTNNFMTTQKGFLI